MNNKNNIEITTQNDIDKYIELLIQKAEKEIELLFARRLKIIKQEINDMFEKYQADVHMSLGLNLINTIGSIRN